ncbi:MAG: sugar ABC transporter permease [Gorillibacterium sp.]|nr:sugar ABC transporter permease [Gorillibacterium sp.]
MKRYWTKTWPYHVLLLPAVLLCLVFSYVPLAGLVIAFQNYEPWVGIANSTWVGFEHFHYLFTYPDSKQVIVNTLLISCLKLVFQLIFPLGFALLLNEMRAMLLKKVIQTMVYLPHFISWVVLGGILIDILGNDGIVNRLITLFGFQPVFFMGNGNWFRFVLIASDVWKEFGFSAIIFLAALTSINPVLYEAAEIDGATKWKQMVHVTLPCILPIIVVVATLSLGRILDAGFDQILNLYNPLVYAKSDIIDTFVYRVGLQKGEFSFGTAVGLFKSTIGFIMIVVSYRMAYKIANYRIF